MQRRRRGRGRDLWLVDVLADIGASVVGLIGVISSYEQWLGVGVLLLKVVIRLAVTRKARSICSVSRRESGQRVRRGDEAASECERLSRCPEGVGMRNL